MLSGRQFDFMKCAFIAYIIQNRARGCLPISMRRRTDEKAPEDQYVLKSDVRRLLGVGNVWINHRIETGGLKTLVRSKGKKRLIFIKIEDVARITTERP